ncbi:carbohydrate ABC transporter permease [Cohnella sp.]|uniref:carbohydrate ABC transporter permease n=1 Tax=Cohnella sp. TaxID=1883426 RepID=UPI003568E3D4
MNSQALIAKGKHSAWSITRAVLLIGLIFVVIYPILLKAITAVKHKDDIYNPVVLLVPEKFTLDNVAHVIGIMDYWQTLLNTFGLSAITMILQLVACSLAGYGFAKWQSKKSSLLFAGVVATILIPPQTIVLPMYLSFQSFDFLGIMQLFGAEKGLNLLNTYWPFILTGITANGLKSGLYIYIFRQFFMNMPKDLEEAAFVDGASVFKTFTGIILPSAVPAIVTVALFSFVWQWNDTFFVSSYLPGMQILSNELLSLSSEVGRYVTQGMGLGYDEANDPFYHAMLVSTGLMLAILPLIIMYFFVQRLFVESIERTGIVG